jgi:hypothetical protein
MIGGNPSLRIFENWFDLTTEARGKFTGFLEKREVSPRRI